MKKLFLAIIALAFTGGAMAQKLAVQEVNIAPDGTAKLTVSYEAGETTMAGAQFNLELPAGINVVEEDEVLSYELSSAQKNFTESVEAKPAYILAVIYGKNKTARLAEGELISFDLKADAGLAEGELAVKLTGVTFSTPDAKSISGADAEGKIIVANPTSINQLTADIMNGAEVYDLFGKKVTSAKKGVYVVNGKKVIVK